jgi:gamma-tubulin complex component 2
MRENKGFSDPPFKNDILKNYDTYLKNQDFSKPIMKSYEWANKNLTKLILVDFKLLDRLRSIKHFFFLERGDFFVHFMDSTESELTKKVALISKEKLKGLLEVAIEQSSTSTDSYAQDILCSITSFTLLEQITAL